MTVLEGVTLCAVDCLRPGLALAALRRSMGQCRFERVLLLTDGDVAAEGVEVRRIPALRGREGYSGFVLHGLAAHVRTEFVLLVQWDGWVIDGGLWEEGFLGCDYVGAPWSWQAPGRQVGNGGFSLRSARLLRALMDLPAGHPEDAQIGRVLRPELEARGIRFAEPGMARRFSVEMEPASVEQPCFGFHGLHQAWRALGAGELAELLAEAPEGWLRGDGADFTVAAYAVRGRWAEARMVLGAAERLDEGGMGRRLSRLGVDGEGLRAAILARG